MPLLLLLPLLLATAAPAAPAAELASREFDQRAATDFDTTGFRFEIAAGPYQPDARSFAEHYRCPEWFRDAKFGIYMHWGLGSVAGLNGHYGRYMYHQQEPVVAKLERDAGYASRSGYRPGTESVYRHHVAIRGHPSKFGYKDFIPLWKAERFDANALAAFFREIGARYVGVMAVHHDNFDLYDSTHQPWNSVRMGPRRDIVRDWQQACAKAHLRFAITSHLSNGAHEHWFFQGETDATGPLQGVPYDTVDPQNEGLYGQRTPNRLKRLNPAFAQSWYRRTKELIDHYQPDLLYLDGGLPNGAYGLHLAAHFYNASFARHGRQEGVFTIKDRAMAGFTFDIESANVEHAMAQPWQTDTTLNPGWFYLGETIGTNRQADDAGMASTSAARRGPDRIRLNAGQVIDNLVDIVSKNGNLLLNVGLRPDGSLPDTFRHELLEIGRWLTLNGEAIYDTRPFTVYGEGPFKLPVSKSKYNDDLYRFTATDIRFTRTKDGQTLYAILLDWPADGRALVTTLADGREPATLRTVTLLGHAGPLPFTRDATGLAVTLPDRKPGDHAYVLKITF